MTGVPTLEELAAVAKSSASEYHKMTHEQALVYAVEDTVELSMPWQEIAREDLSGWVEKVCHAEGLEPPEIFFARKSQNVRASANCEQHAIRINGRTTNIGVVLHELAHLSSGSGAHQITFRNEFVRLVRRHASVEHAALMHGLFLALELPMAPWQSLG